MTAYPEADVQYSCNDAIQVEIDFFTQIPSCSLTLLASRSDNGTVDQVFLFQAELVED